MKSIDLTRRRLLAAAIAILVANSPNLSASDCKLVNAQLEGSVQICAASPVGLCASGKIQSGLLAGDFSAVRDALAPGAGLGTVSPQTVAYSASVTVSAVDGKLRLRQVGVSDPVNRGFVELLEIVAGRGRFKGARGFLRVTGRWIRANSQRACAARSVAIIASAEAKRLNSDTALELCAVLIEQVPSFDTSQSNKNVK